MEGNYFKNKRVDVNVKRPPPGSPVLQRHEPQRQHLGDLQLRGPLSRRHAAEHPALLPDAGALELHRPVVGPRWTGRRSRCPGRPGR